MADTPISDKELNEAEESIIHLAKAFGLTDKEMVRVIADGIEERERSFNATPSSDYVIEELKATFSAW